MLRAICLALLICPEVYARSVVPVATIDPTAIPAGTYELRVGAGCVAGTHYRLVYGCGYVFLAIPDTEICFVGRPHPGMLQVVFKERFVLLFKPVGDGTLRGQFIIDGRPVEATLVPVAE